MAKIDFDPNVLSPYFSYRESTVSIGIGPAGAQICRRDGSRVVLAINNAAANATTIRPGTLPVSPYGFPLAPNAPLTFDFATYGVLVQSEWYVFTASSAVLLYVLEVLFKPPG